VKTKQLRTIQLYNLVQAALITGGGQSEEAWSAAASGVAK